MTLSFKRFSLFLSALAVAGAAHAFERPFPANAKRGTMSPAAYPTIVIDGKTRNLAASARIWNTNNTIDMPNSIAGSDMKVNYTENAQGEIDRVWILTAQEAAQPAPDKQAK